MRRRIFGAALMVVALAAGLGGIKQIAAQDQRSSPVLPVFEVDPNFPIMPDRMLLG